MKKIYLMVVFGCCLTVSVLAQAQQITRVAVIDLPRVYTTFFRDSQAVREFEARSARVQAEIERMNREILELRSRNADAIAQGDQTQSLRLENEIRQRSELLREFHSVRTAELEDQRRRLVQSDSFLEQVHSEIRRVSESEGVSLVLRTNPEIVWFSPSVDITDRVIQGLVSRSQR